MSADMYALLAVPVFCLMGNGILRVCKAWYVKRGKLLANVPGR